MLEFSIIFQILGLISFVFIGYYIWKRFQKRKYLIKLMEEFDDNVYENAKDYIESGFPNLSKSDKKSMLYDRELLEYYKESSWVVPTKEMDKRMLEIYEKNKTEH